MRKDTAAELYTRFDAFLSQLEKVIALLPEYLKFDPKKPSIHNLIGFIPRHKHRHTHGEAGRVKEQNQYDALCQLLKKLHEHGVALKAVFYSQDGKLADKIAVMEQMSRDNKIIGYIMAYFAASTTIGLIQNDIKPLMTSLAETVRIAPSGEFLKEFKALMELATNRSSKISLMLGAVDHEARGELSAETQQQFDKICQRIDELAKVSDLIVGLNAFTLNPVQKSAEQLARERIAQQLAEEAGAKPEESAQVRVLRDFYHHFDLHLLPYFIDHIRNWEIGETESLQVLTNNISTFISIHDQKCLSPEPKFENVEITAEEFTQLAEAITVFKNGGEQRSLLDILTKVRQRNKEHHEQQRDKRSIEFLRRQGILGEGPMSKYRPLPPGPGENTSNDPMQNSNL